MKRKEDPKYIERVAKNQDLKSGDKVTIHDCFEADLYEGQEFTVTGEPYQICGTQCVFLRGVGAFDIGRLEKAN